MLVSEISSSLVNIDPPSVDSVLEQALQKILDLLHVDRAVLFQKENGSERMVVTHAKTRPGCGPPSLNSLTSDEFPWMLRQHQQRRETRYSRIDDLPKEAEVDKRTLRRYGPKYSAMAVPLVDGSGTFGVLALGIAEEKKWPEELSSRIRLLAHVFGGALLRKKAELQLQETLVELKKLKTQLENENLYLRHEVEAQCAPNKMVYKSQPMIAVMHTARQVASTNSTVMLSGETGTGKEMLARAIHEWSPRSGHTMVCVNCGAIPAALIESELFGREKGAYTGALTRQIGRFELASGSTIFLDEVTELSLEMQVKLLRVLQEKEIERLGNPRPIAVDVRVIAASNANLSKAVQEGKFREDLYYRLNVFPIEIPPLRKRREDIPPLVWTFVDELSAAFGKKIEKITDENMELLMNYPWPGNVRELRNAIERAMIVCNSPVLQIQPPGGLAVSVQPSNLTLRELEVQHIRKVLEGSQWRIRGKNGAAEILGMKPTTLETRMMKLGIVRPRT